MALNDSFWSEDSLYSPVKFCKQDGSSDSLRFGSCSEELGKSQLQEIGKADDILDRLPSDPFGMDMRSTVTAITCWIQDFENKIGFDYLDFEMNETREDFGYYQLFGGLNLSLNATKRFRPDAPASGEFVVDDESNGSEFVSAGNLEEFLRFGHEDDISSQAQELQDCSGIHSDGEGSDPHEALFFALGYLGVQDLLSVERVCRSFCDAVRTDPLLWRSIHVNQPLSERITDDALIQVTSRAQGTLQCLNLVECRRITDGGLQRVLESNPMLTKLCVPGCVRLSVETILFHLRALKSAGTLKIKQLRVSGLSGTDEQFDELKFLLDADNNMQMKAHQPRFYRGQLYLSCDDDRTIDIEACPRCQKFGMVYDCPAESCQKKHHDTQICRACTLCIERCIHCGCCIKDCDYEETFSLDSLCFDCLEQMLNFRSSPAEKGSSSSNCTIFHQETRYQFCLYG